jgi:hypothetical protein
VGLAAAAPSSFARSDERRQPLSLAGAAMLYEHPKTMAAEFLCDSPDATEHEAVAFAIDQFPESPVSLAEFLYHWRNMSGTREMVITAERS